MIESISLSSGNTTLTRHVTDAINEYISSTEGLGISDLYAFILESTEEPLLETVMQHTSGNQVRATELLGISRTTLRKKLAKYFGNKYFKIKD